jgi:hypothetical protein
LAGRYAVDDQAHQSHSKAETYTERMQNAPAGTITLIDHQEIRTAGEADDQRCQENNDESF